MKTLSNANVDLTTESRHAWDSVDKGYTTVSDVTTTERDTVDEQQMISDLEGIK